MFPVWIFVNVNWTMEWVRISFFLFARNRPHCTRNYSITRMQKIDLVLHSPTTVGSAFIEFKFYIHNASFDAYTGEQLPSWKSFPSKQNKEQFVKCIEKLRARKRQPKLRKFIVLFYADPIITNRARYSETYSNIKNIEGTHEIKQLHCHTLTCDSSKIKWSLHLFECP